MAVLWWTELTPAERTSITSEATVRSFRAGAVVLQEGDRADDVLVIMKGLTKVTRRQPDGRPSVLGVRGPGELLGELAALDRTARCATVAAVRPTTVLTVTAAGFDRFLTQHRHAEAVVRRVLTERLREAAHRQALGGTPAAARHLAVLLLELHHRYGYPVTGREVLIGLPVSRDDLADCVSATRRAVGAILRDWHSQAIVTGAARRITIHDLSALRSVADGGR